MGSSFPTESMGHRRALVLIPARYSSTRFPGKPLALIQGKPMIQRVYENIQNQPLKGRWHFQAFVVTDDERIEKCVKGFGGNCLRIDDDVISGSERICLAYQRYLKTPGANKNSEAMPDFIINVQGDEPLLQAQDLEGLVQFHFQNNFDITTFYRPIENDLEGFQNPNRVKAVVSPSGQCIYFSRSPVPHFPIGISSQNEKGKDKIQWNLHVGVYCYKPEALEKFNSLPPSPLEKREKLEQLRALENGMTVGAIKLNKQLVGVDEPGDVAVIEGVLRGQGN